MAQYKVLCGCGHECLPHGGAQGLQGGPNAGARSGGGIGMTTAVDLFPFQDAISQWAVNKGRAAIFADTGLGKTRMQLTWAEAMAGRTIILAPLAVALQTEREAQLIGVDAGYARHPDQVSARVTIANYEMVDRFNPQDYQAVVLDESSILKNVDAKTRGKLTGLFAQTPYRLCCTATPSPNDIAELTNHAEFLGIMRRTDVLAKFFVHDDDGWRLKGHAQESFWEWVSTWAMALQRPSDLGYTDDGYDLPSLNIHHVEVEGEAAAYAQATGQLFATELRGLHGRLAARKTTVEQRAQKAIDLISEHPDDQWLVWCGLNEEGRLLKRYLSSATLIEGAHSFDTKMDAARQFADGGLGVLISKPSIMGFGMNFQKAHRMIFLGINDSFETYYQAIRRCWRFGQQEAVDVYTIMSDLERPVWDNVQRKAKEHEGMVQKMMGFMSDFGKAALHGAIVDHERMPDDTASGQGWTLHRGDSTAVLPTLEPDSVDLTVFSPPFLSLFVYSDGDRDLGNSDSENVFMERFRPIVAELLRVTKPGRLAVVHVAQVAATLAHDGFIGIKDFRGAVIKLFIEEQFHYHGDVTIDKNPQAQAIRTHAKALLFKQLRKDASWLRPGLADYMLLFRKPGEPAIPIQPDISNEEWIEWAHPVWYGMRETDTLNVALARAERDERHICPLQLPVIERCIRLWSNPGDVVLSPFAGIGSEGYVALQQKRRFVGVELKDSYYRVACRNLDHAATTRQGQMEMV